MDALPPQLGQFSGKLSAVIAELPLPGGHIFQFSYFQALAMAGLIFLLILVMGQLRHRFAHWQMGGIMPGVAFGFAIALVLEGIFIIGGRTIITELLGWKDAPKPIVNVLDVGRTRLVNVLGVVDEVPASNVRSVLDKMLLDWQNLTPEERTAFQSQICK